MRLAEEKIKELANKLKISFPQILFAYLFGSASEGKLSASSDIDVAVYLQKGMKSAELIAGIIGTVEEVMEEYSCDLLILNDAGTLIAMETLKGKILFIRESSRDDHAEFYSLTCRMFEDQTAWMKKQLKYRGHEIQWDH